MAWNNLPILFNLVVTSRYLSLIVHIIQSCCAVYQNTKQFAILVAANYTNMKKCQPLITKIFCTKLLSTICIYIIYISYFNIWTYGNMVCKP